jgi:hypothetical protein
MNIAKLLKFNTDNWLKTECDSNVSPKYYLSVTGLEDRPIFVNDAIGEICYPIGEYDIRGGQVYYSEHKVIDMVQYNDKYLKEVENPFYGDRF